MDDSSGGVGMVEGPDAEKAVFVRGRRGGEGRSFCWGGGRWLFVGGGL